MLGKITGRLGDVIAFDVFIPAYDIVSFRRSLEVTYDTIDNVLAIYVGVLGCLLS